MTSGAGPILYDIGTATSDAHVLIGPYFESIFSKQQADILRALRGDRDLGPGDWVQELLDFRARPPRKKGELKAPSLVNVWDHVLFFHDGRASSLEEAVHVMSTQVGLGLTGDDERAVVEYLKTR
jgi:cytochrome c peroxidase